MKLKSYKMYHLYLKKQIFNSLKTINLNIDMILLKFLTIMNKFYLVLDKLLLINLAGLIKNAYINLAN